MIVIDIILFLVGFLLIWYGAGLIIHAVDGFSKKLKMSSFVISFFVLGMLTSIPEFAVGITAISAQRPNIFVGNLLGGVAVIFLFVIPVLAILGKEVKMSRALHRSTVLFSLCVTAAPVIFILDQSISNIEAIFLIASYFTLFYFIQSQQGIVSSYLQTRFIRSKKYSLQDIIYLLLGVMIVFFSSNVIVEKTLFFAELLHVTPFLISLVVLSLGTNLPELSLAVRAIFLGKKDIAMGDYMGSAAANTLLFGVFTLLSKGSVIEVGNFALTFFFIILGMGMFYIFSRSEKNISRVEGTILLGVYIIFVLFEFIKGVE